MTPLLTLTPAQFCDETGACLEGRDFAIKRTTMADVWDACQNVSWLIFVAEKIGGYDRELRLFAVWCARNTPLADGRKTGDFLTDPRSLKALVVAEKFANGEATQEELRAARDAAWAAARAVRDARDAVRDAAWAAAWDARDAARDAAWAAAWAARDVARSAARDAVRDARDAVRDAARDAQLAQFRAMIPNPFKEAK